MHKHKLDEMDNDTAICVNCRRVISGGLTKFVGSGLAHATCPR